MAVFFLNFSCKYPNLIQPDVGKENHHSFRILVFLQLQLGGILEAGSARTSEEVGIAKVSPGHFGGLRWRHSKVFNVEDAVLIMTLAKDETVFREQPAMKVLQVLRKRK